mmetsp:Transcript_19172/g.31036  ORF Transcript_19172/g.31036 Transcript_19172/m.31036 type:complete len:241 (-) Transcript_19172:52-774(-)
MYEAIMSAYLSAGIAEPPAAAAAVTVVSAMVVAGDSCCTCGGLLSLVPLLSLAATAATAAAAAGATAGATATATDAVTELLPLATAVAPAAADTSAGNKRFPELGTEGTIRNVSSPSLSLLSSSLSGVVGAGEFLRVTSGSSSGARLAPGVALASRAEVTSVATVALGTAPAAAASALFCTALASHSLGTKLRAMVKASRTVPTSRSSSSLSSTPVAAAPTSWPMSLSGESKTFASEVSA